MTNHKKKPIRERQEAYKNMLKWIKESFTKEETEAFLYEEICPDSVFEKLKDFAIN